MPVVVVVLGPRLATPDDGGPPHPEPSRLTPTTMSTRRVSPGRTALHRRGSCFHLLPPRARSCRRTLYGTEGNSTVPDLTRPRQGSEMHVEKGFHPTPSETGLLVELETYVGRTDRLGLAALQSAFVSEE
jgi:hypothetical protein